MKHDILCLAYSPSVFDLTDNVQRLLVGAIGEGTARGILFLPCRDVIFVTKRLHRENAYCYWPAFVHGALALYKERGHVYKLAL